MALTSRISDAYLRLVADMAARFRARGARVSGLDLLAVWLGESGLDSHRRNGAGAPAYGTNQLWAPLEGGGYPGLRAVGFAGSPEDYLALSLEQQLPHVERYYDNATHGDASLLASRGALYMVNFVPAWIAHASDPDWVIARRDDADRQKAAIYRENAVLDTGAKGYIDVADMDAFPARAIAGSGAFWPELEARYLAIAGSEGRDWRRLAGYAVLAAAALAVLHGLNPKALPALARRM